MPRETFPGCWCQCPCPCDKPLLTHVSSGNDPTVAGSFGSVSCGITTPFLWVFVCTKVSLCPPRRVSGSPSPVDIMKSCWSSRSDSLGITSPFVGFPGWETWCRVQNFHTVGKLLWYYHSPICGSPTQLVWDLILLWLHPSYHLGAASSLSLDMGYIFLVVSSIPLSIRVQQLVVILVLLQEMSAHPSTLPSWLKFCQSLSIKAFTHVNNLKKCWQWIVCLN